MFLIQKTLETLCVCHWTFDLVPSGSIMATELSDMLNNKLIDLVLWSNSTAVNVTFRLPSGKHYVKCTDIKNNKRTGHITGICQIIISIVF